MGIIVNPLLPNKEESDLLDAMREEKADPKTEEVIEKIDDVLFSVTRGIGLFGSLWRILRVFTRGFAGLFR